MESHSRTLDHEGMSISWPRRSSLEEDPLLPFGQPLCCQSGGYTVKPLQVDFVGFPTDMQCPEAVCAKLPSLSRSP